MSHRTVIVVLAACLIVFAVAYAITRWGDYRREVALIYAARDRQNARLRARGIDPDDRSEGWLERANTALAPRQVRVGETFDLAPHEKAEVIIPGGAVLLAIDGGPGGIQGARIG